MPHVDPDTLAELAAKAELVDCHRYTLRDALLARIEDLNEKITNMTAARKVAVATATPTPTPTPTSPAPLVTPNGLTQLIDTLTARRDAALRALKDLEQAVRPVRRCDADARKGTGHGTCDRPLDSHGQCDRASDHVTP